ncbi:TetR/AcrR family transcriptional regulator [uncultured Endozoicomonas sp.]|uniref:TetR/AcrR family transcriptional regulator n=1 Tax=uncultured Endozoicomonas sp. TaxID=432652 RepID=UPI0026027E69|nr:TetR/AcrR family transcriptional regulator [uncultured Endozoicomonas sp.]
MAEKKPKDKKNYHHGSLRQGLMDEATRMIALGGAEGLSMRKLADNVGVSRTAAYHHFKDKNALLCAIAEQGFQKWQSHFALLMDEQSGDMSVWLGHFVQGYLNFSRENQEQYDLMFGRTIWKNGAPTATLKKASFSCFHNYVDLIRQWQVKGYVDSNLDCLRIAQVSWSTLHGMSRLLNDGIYLDKGAIDAMSKSAVEMILSACGTQQLKPFTAAEC